MERQRERHAFQQLQQEHREPEQGCGQIVQEIPSRLFKVATVPDVAGYPGTFEGVTLVSASGSPPDMRRVRRDVGALLGRDSPGFSDLGLTAGGKIPILDWRICHEVL